MTQLFVSDLHLESPGSVQFSTFQALLEHESPHASAIYILGDLCEVWVGDDDDGPLANSLRTVLAAAAKRCPVFVMRGNRDFLFGDQFARESGTTLLEDPHRLADGTLLSHGDVYCVDDADYQQLRERMRSTAWQTEILGRSLAQRRQLAAAMRSQSQLANANKAENIMDVATTQVHRSLRDHDAWRLIHGHTHRPAVHDMAGRQRVVLGAWDKYGWLFRAGVNSGLECFALTGRYEI